MVVSLLLPLSHRANLTYDSMKKEHASEIAVFNVAMKKNAMQVESLERTIRQKVSL